ncbi:MAG: ROK family protein [Rhodocyclaceae bacterium]|nr:ROK family protein [Rhodocyclaceae bacterium]
MRIGIDLGGTKIEILVVDDDGRQRHRRRVATPRDDYEATLAAMVALVGEAERAVGAHCSVGVGTPGSRSPVDGRMRNANSTCLNGRPLADDLARLLSRPVRLANDANCLAVSEAVDGAGAGAGVVFAVILGTGVGGGIAIEQRVWDGASGVAGEWGHNPLPAPGAEDLPLPACYCGRSGCIETFLSGPGLAADHRKHGGDASDAQSVVAAALAGDEACEQALQRYERRLARALAGVINVLDPEVIVLGGGLSKVGRWLDTVPRLWRAHVFSDRVGTRLVASRHGDASGVRGAAWLWGVGEYRG